MSTLSTTKPLLVYWNIRALGEPIRFLLNYLEVDFEDRRIEFGGEGQGVLDIWTQQKHSYGVAFPNLPLYIDGDVKLTQSLTIMAYIGRKHNLCGDSTLDQTTLDMVCQTVQDLRWQAWLVYQSPKFHEIKDDWKAGLPLRLSEMNCYLEGKDFILGDKISYGDFFLYEILEWFRAFAKDTFEKEEGLKNLNKFQKRIEDLPQIKAYMESDKFRDWPFWGPYVHFGFSKDPDFKPEPVSFKNFMAKCVLE